MNKDSLIWNLEELSDKSLQEKLWLGNVDGEMSTFEEATCGVFDDSGLSDILDSDKKRASIPDGVVDACNKLRKAIQKVPRDYFPQTLVASKEMDAVRSAADDLLMQVRSWNYRPM